MKTKHNFRTVRITSSNDLEDVVKSNITGSETTYYLFLNSWDKVSNYFNGKVDKMVDSGALENLYVVDIFDVPNALGIIQSAIRELRGNISTHCLNSFGKVPMMLRLYGASPVVVDYNGSIAAELGV